MSTATANPIDTGKAATPDAMREAWRKANVRPLWENPLAHNQKKAAPKAHLWTWSVLGPLIADAMTITSMAAIERRVLTLVDPDAQGNTAGTTTNLTAALQILMPGESARPHRHSMNALRFVIDGSGASTKVDGRDCPMEERDLVITPGWTWHEHIHKGSAPIVWLDALDAPLHRHLGTDAFEPGPPHDVPDYAAATLPSRSPTWCRSSRTARRASRRCSAIRGPTRRARSPPPPRGRTARAGCATPIRRPAGRRCRSSTATWSRSAVPRRSPSHHQQRGLLRRRGHRHEPHRRRDLRLGAEGHLHPASRQLDHPPRRWPRAPLHGHRSRRPAPPRSPDGRARQRRDVTSAPLRPDSVADVTPPTAATIGRRAPLRPPGGGPPGRISPADIRSASSRRSARHQECRGSPSPRLRSGCGWW